MGDLRFFPRFINGWVLTNKWSEISINKSPIYLYTLESGLCYKNCKLFNITKFTLVLPTFRLRLQSIYCLVHASFALKTGAVSREESKKFGVFLKKIYIYTASRLPKLLCNKLILFQSLCKETLSEATLMHSSKKKFQQIIQ